VVRYFTGGSEAFLRGMGVDPGKLPDPKVFLERLLADHERPDDRKERLYLAWFYRGEQIGHSSLSNIRPGEDAYIHLHLWKPELRRAGVGTELFKLATRFAIERFALKRVFCEPYAENAAPNRVLEKTGFRLVRRHRTVPGAINFEQDVNLWVFEAPPPRKPV